MPLVLALLLLVLTGCSGPFPQSVFAPKSDYSTAIDGLFWNIFWWAVVVFVIVETLLIVAIVRYRARSGAAAPKPVHGHTALEIGWTLAPALILVFIAVPTMRTIFATAGHAPEGALRVEVIGRQWWWEFRYPDLGIVTANELHLPVQTPVRLAMTSGDVIHSFWAPALGGKRDVTQGRTTYIAFTADSTGAFLGQCAEFCGASHANMRLRVFVESDSVFRAWAAHQREPAPPPAPGSVAERGRELFVRSGCIACHTVAGVPQARGFMGPNLTHFGTRTTFASALFPNTADYLRRWIADSRAVKPGSMMPPTAMSQDDLGAVVAYLQSLK